MVVLTQTKWRTLLDECNRAQVTGMRAIRVKVSS